MQVEVNILTVLELLLHAKSFYHLFIQSPMDSLCVMYLCTQIVMMHSSWWAHSMRLWSYVGCATIPSTLKPRCLVLTAVLLRGINALDINIMSLTHSDPLYSDISGEYINDIAKHSIYIKLLYIVLSTVYLILSYLGFACFHSLC